MNSETIYHPDWLSLHNPYHQKPKPKTSNYSSDFLSSILQDFTWKYLEFKFNLSALVTWFPVSDALFNEIQVLNNFNNHLSPSKLKRNPWQSSPWSCPNRRIYLEYFVSLFKCGRNMGIFCLRYHSHTPCTLLILSTKTKWMNKPPFYSDIFSISGLLPDCTGSFI